MFILYCLSFSFPFYLPSAAGTASTTTPSSQYTKQATHQAATNTPFICVLIAYYPLSLLLTNTQKLTANIAFIFYYTNKV